MSDGNIVLDQSTVSAHDDYWSRLTDEIIRIEQLHEDAVILDAKIELDGGDGTIAVTEYTYQVRNTP